MTIELLEIRRAMRDLERSQAANAALQNEISILRGKRRAAIAEWIEGIATEEQIDEIQAAIVRLALEAIESK